MPACFLNNISDFKLFEDYLNSDFQIQMIHALKLNAI